MDMLTLRRSAAIVGAALFGLAPGLAVATPDPAPAPTTVLVPDAVPDQHATQAAPVSLLNAESLLDWQPAKLPPYGSIMAFGDEITRGMTADHRIAYPPLLAAILKREVFNQGNRGETTISQVHRLEEALAHRHPTVVILGTGRADRTRGLDYFQMQENLTHMIQTCHKYGARVLLLALPYSTSKREDPHEKIARQAGFLDPGRLPGQPPPRPRLQTEDEKLRDRLLIDKLFVDIARENQIAIDLYSVSYAIAHPDTATPDGMPNAKGNEVMAQYVADALRRYTMTDDEVKALIPPTPEE